MTPQSPTRVHYPALDVLRGIAISLVVVYHNFDFLHVFRFGWLGVDLFFVLSGFLITDLLLSTKENRFFFRNFYIRRALRIFPLYYLTLILFYVLAPHFFSQKDQSSTYVYYSENKIWFLSCLQNLLFAEKGQGPMPYLSHFWSLAVEEQFYLFWPVLVFLIKDLKKLRNTVLLLIAVALCTRLYTYIQSPVHMEKYYCNTITRMDSLLAGCFLAIWMKEGKVISKRVIQTTLLIGALFIFLSITLFKNVSQTNVLFASFGYTFFAIFFSCILYLFITSKSIFLNWVKNVRSLSLLGKLSYGIYVYHLPIYLILNSQLYRILTPGFGLTYNDTTYLSSILSVLLTLIASLLSFYFLEKPILNLKRHFH